VKGGSNRTYTKEFAARGERKTQIWMTGGGGKVEKETSAGKGCVVWAVGGKVGSKGSSD